MNKDSIFINIKILHYYSEKKVGYMNAYFNNISQQISNELIVADKTICLALAWFTNEILFELLMKKVRNGVMVELIVNNDHINNRYDGLDFNEFINLGGKFYFADSKRLMHNKFVIIDNNKLISGSYNWTYNAEHRNNENIIITSNPNMIDQFNNEFNALKSNGFLQLNKIQLKAVKTFEIDITNYLKDDYYSKSFIEEKRGNMKKSLKAIQAAKLIDESDLKISKRLDEVQKVIDKPIYNYHIEDGQFSFDFIENRLLGREGQIIRHYTDRMDTMKDEFYILFVDGHYVECIGNIERRFPKNKQEHNELKETILKLYKEY
jgi:hypothetical protein